ncbi:carbohydrate kinase [Babesia gibsoni]|uniref:glycerol kinase n=1 Tax=Babesia gibsoni TaxID=33632 RepID=A0AAD8LLU1_BABGI|nr:carbohydrate kinase [Babesia gibsoni]
MRVIVAIDQGTQSTRCVFFDENLNTVAASSRKHTQFYPQSGWCEHDPVEIMECVYDTMNEAFNELSSKNVNFEIVGLGITNQRETVIAWDAKTGKPLHNAIVWLDIRGEGEAQSLIDTYGSPSVFAEKTGLKINSYFSAVKLRWMSNNLPWFKNAVEGKTVRFGTIDCWIIYNLTGEYVTDVTNASRTLLMDISKERWSTQMLQVFELNTAVLPKILPNCADFGTINNTRVPNFNGIKITGCAGDQQAACLGQSITDPYATKCTLGTGGFVLINTGNTPIRSTGGLLCTPCYKLSETSETVYALEGSIAIVGAGVTWLQNMGIIKEPQEISDILRECPRSGGVVFVPAFSGLFAPRWRADARACIMGMTQHTDRKHVVRAFCESIGMQIAEIIQPLLGDTGRVKVPYICIDGGLSKNPEIMQLVSDIVGIPIEIPSLSEATCLGAAILAGLRVNLWTMEQVKEVTGKRKGRWNPNMDEEQRNEIVKYWNMGVDRALLWH